MLINLKDVNGMKAKVHRYEPLRRQISLGPESCLALPPAERRGCGGTILIGAGKV